MVSSFIILININDDLLERLVELLSVHAFEGIIHLFDKNLVEMVN